MTIEEMRTATGLPPEASDAEVVGAYAALIDDGMPVSIELVEPVTVAQARVQCRIDDEIEDDLIAQKIGSAREWVEDFTGRIITRRTLTQHFRCWDSYLQLHHRPIVSVDAIAYNGEDGDGVYADAAYAIGAYPLRIYPGAVAFPALRTGGGITVVYTAGYDAGEVPASMIEAVLVLVGGMMSEREGAYVASRNAAIALVERRRTPVMA